MAEYTVYTRDFHVLTSPKLPKDLWAEVCAWCREQPGRWHCASLASTLQWSFEDETTLVMFKLVWGDVIWGRSTG